MTFLEFIVAAGNRHPAGLRRGSLETNLAMILLGGLVTLAIQRRAYLRRRARHREATGESLVRRELRREGA